MAIILHSGICACHTPPSFGHGHSHGGNSTLNCNGDQEGQELRDPSSEITVKKPSKRKHINVRAAFIHVIGDLIQSIGVLVAAYVIKYKVLQYYLSSDPPVENTE